MTGQRHVLIVATQCRSQPPLLHLDTAAGELARVLADPAIGGCAAGLPGDEMILAGADLTADLVNAAVRAAIMRAAAAQATLVLAFLGHGFVPGNTPTLHYMTPESEVDERASAVNVTVLLTEAIDMPGVDSVIALVDTCNAAGAAVEKSAVAHGARAGRLRYELLMASAVHQEAFDLRLSRTVAELLAAGFPGGPAALTPRSILYTLRRRIPDQLIVFDSTDAADGAEDSLWLASNVAFRDYDPYAVTSSREVTELPALLAAAGLPPDLAGERNLHGLMELKRRLVAAGPRGMRALAVVDGLLVAHRTAAFLNTSLPAALSGAAFRRALTVADIDDDIPVPTSDELALLTHLAVRYPRADGDCRRQVMRFVVALATDLDAHPDWDSVGAWAATINARLAFNEAQRDLSGKQMSRRLRLIISLHAAEPGTMWPTTVFGWLHNGEQVIEQRQVGCAEGPAGAADAVGDLVDWGSRATDALGLELVHVDIAVPTGLLSGDWQPEDIRYHRRLGEQFIVTVRWADRLKPSGPMRRSIGYAVQQLRAIAGSRRRPPVDLLDDNALADPAALEQRLVNGAYPHAIGLVRRPDDSGTALALLLHHSPIVLWPRTTAELPMERWSCLAEHWERLPDSFPLLYRRLAHGEPTDDAAQLRAIWDDERWLDFCHRLQHAEDRS